MPAAGSRKYAGSIAWPVVMVSLFVLKASGWAVNDPSGESATAIPMVLWSYVRFWPLK